MIIYELDYVNGTSDMVSLVEQLKNGLISRATGGIYKNDEYVLMRKRLLNDRSFEQLVPQFIKSCRTTDEFWGYIKMKFSTYGERREYIAIELNPLIEAIEQTESNEKMIINTDSYEIGERIGGGGFGEVYKYHHKLLDIDFAIKVLNPAFVPEDEKEEYNQRFFREAKILFELDHPNIVKVFDTGIIGARPFIRMEYIEGYNMDEFMKDYSKVSFKRSLKPITALLEGLSYAHKKGIIHRDLKPSNYMVTQDRRFKIIDFGISAYVESELHTRLTKTGENIVGGHYIDPELMHNPKLKDVRSDIYSVGALWYYLLTGRAPAGSDVRQNLLDSSDVTNLQADIIMKCLSQNINVRYSTCDELLIRINPPKADSEHNVINNSAIQITEVTRMDMFDYFNEQFREEMEEFVYNRSSYNSDNSEPERVFHYYGRNREVEFLNRLYKLADMPSNDSRVDTFEKEILQHTISNNDWPEYWIFDDERLGLRNGNDETLLKFLCQMFHPLVRSKNCDWQSVMKGVNELLQVDGYELFESDKISNKPVYSYRVTM